MEILRMFFSGSAGQWEGCGLLGMKLAPPPGSEGSLYFPIQDEVIAKSPAISGTTSSLLGQSIVPIVALIKPEQKFLPVGTGFFISCSGLLITAAHVVTDPIDRDYGGSLTDTGFHWDPEKMDFGVLLPNHPFLMKPGFHFYPFEWTAFLAERAESPLPFGGIDLKLTTDIAICKVIGKPGGEPHQPLSIVQPGLVGTGMQEGSEMIAVGYPGPEDGQTGFQLQMFVTRGTITERFPDNLASRTVSTPGPCFSCSAVAQPGMSGGPIFDKERIYVHGVISKGLKDEGGHAQHSYGSMLAGSMQIPIGTMNDATLCDLLSAGTEGMPRLSVPGA